MCGRFSFASPGEVVAEAFGLEATPNLTPRYNIAPTQAVAALRTRSGSPELVFLRWGLVPSWAQDPSVGNRLINARGETAAVKPSFRSAWRSRRCGVLADGFYEWQRLDGRRLPWHFRRRDRQPFAIAGLWESWRPEDDSPPLETCTLLTVPANQVVAPVHDRMPVLLDAPGLAVWLAGPGPGDAQVVRPAPEEPMERIAVSPRVNNPRFDDPNCLETPG